MHTPRLSVVDWTDAPARLNGLVRFAERRNMVSTRVPSHFNWPLPLLFTWMGSTSTPKSNVSGLTRGAVLSTTLFALYLSGTPRPPHTHLVLYADDTLLLSQSWRPDTISRMLSNALTTLHKYFTKWKLRLNTHTTETILFYKRRLRPRSPPPDPIQIQDTSRPWAPTVHYLGLMLDYKRLFSRHLHTVANKATGVFFNISPLLARNSAPTQSNKVTIYKLLIRSTFTYAAPLCSSTCSSNYFRLKVI